MSKILIISGQFIPFTKSIGGILRVYSYIKLLKKKHDVFLLVSKPISNKNYGYLGLPRKDLSKVNINYISNKSPKITSSMFNYKLLRNIFYLLGFDYAFYLNRKYLEKCDDLIKKNNINIRFKPFNVRSIMLEMDNRPFTPSKQIKVDHMWRDIQRRAEIYNIVVPSLPVPYPLQNMELANQIASLSAKHLAPLRYTNAVHNASTDEKLQAFVTELADFFENDNPNFHRGKFIHACYNEKK